MRYKLGQHVVSRGLLTSRRTHDKRRNAATLCITWYHIASR